MTFQSKFYDVMIYEWVWKPTENTTKIRCLLFHANAKVDKRTRKCNNFIVPNIINEYIKHQNLPTILVQYLYSRSN